MNASSFSLCALLLDWKCIPDPESAANLYRNNLLREHETRKPLLIYMDLAESVVDREKTLLCFYKTPNREWACPLKCTLIGTYFNYLISFFIIDTIIVLVS